MRLVNTRTLRLEEFFDASTPDYAILSHTWAQDEVIFSDMTDLGKARTKIGFAKLEGACRLAATQKYDYIWIDTCCIDKSSSAELSEAINSMYRWYEKAKVCYAYLCDVKNPTQLVGCKWFTRGWTLQELLAPDDVEFYTLDWVYLGNKRDPSLIPTLSRASLVDAPVLARVIQPWDVSVAKRMYWASSRETTRREDEAYCMMGLFRVNMPLLYGEGSKAFFRLQQEIAKDTHDQSILAWYCEPRRETELARRVGTRSEIDFGCCAPSPSCFAMSGDITSSSAPSPEGSLGQIIFTGPGTEFLAPLKGGDENWSHEDDWKAENETWWDEREIILRCQVGPIPGTFPTLVVVQAANRGQYYRRNLTHGIVSSVSLYTFPSHVEEPNRIRSARRNKIGLQIFAPTTPVNGSSGVATVEGEMRTYPFHG
ncbi:heterokaryon incompatibility protein-domain-containing protein [Chaetomium fimeti]|uniref:Heterokaryon incompatibility protein-domain-containing protein n=1 Tax=Chaetomium fimeti TaxID=1854472 RepID=A0AAE0LT13_9PEZI|nr:heterokaryon incompatibility protein-domain-containing protein [Chaetomium fimeti]